MLAADDPKLRKFREEVRAAGKELSASVEKLLESCGDEKLAPKTVFHFTDWEGLVGIFTQKTLRASLATALNDASETKYALSRLCFHLEVGTIRLKHFPADLLRAFLERRTRIEGLTDDSRAYVVSFCGGANEAIHWLHYGRSGTGVAIGFEAAAFKIEQFSLCPVIYDPKRQDELLLVLVEMVDKFAGDFARRLDGSNRDLFDGIVSHLTTMYLRLLAPRMKDPAFKSEDEWRLISNEMWVKGEVEKPTRKTHFRLTAGRVVPYKEVEFETLPVTEVVLGASTPMLDDEQALAVLMENTLGKTFPVRRSSVSVRP